MKFYIAAPMRRRKQFNFARFDEARDALLARGHEVISPADLDRAAGFDALTMVSPDDPCETAEAFQEFNLTDCVKRDVDAILSCDAVCVIAEDWSSSSGVLAELGVAQWANKPVYFFFPGMEDAVSDYEQACRVDLEKLLARQYAFSLKTFGPNGDRTAGLVDHIRKELDEIIESRGRDVTEWIDVVILAMDGALRAGYSPRAVAHAWFNKQVLNERRKWPDWRTAEPGKAIEHIRE